MICAVIGVKCVWQARYPAWALFKVGSLFEQFLAGFTIKIASRNHRPYWLETTCNLERHSAEEA